MAPVRAISLKTIFFGLEKIVFGDLLVQLLVEIFLVEIAIEVFNLIIRHTAAYYSNASLFEQT